jgi:hypothetical protein
MGCLHENFAANVRVDRILKNEDDLVPAAFHADITVKCADCGIPFEFVGDYPCGLLWDRACVDPSKQELRAPIQPKGITLLPGIPGFTVRMN